MTTRHVKPFCIIAGLSIAVAVPLFAQVQPTCWTWADSVNCSSLSGQNLSMSRECCGLFDCVDCPDVIEMDTQGTQVRGAKSGKTSWVPEIGQGFTQIQLKECGGVFGGKCKNNGDPIQFFCNGEVLAGEDCGSQTVPF